MEHDPTDSVDLPQFGKPQPGRYKAGFGASNITNSFRLDEGYSDETKSEGEHEGVQVSGNRLTLPPWLLGHAEPDRAGIFYLRRVSFLLTEKG